MSAPENDAPVTRDTPVADDGTPVPDSPLQQGTVAERFANLVNDPDKMAAFTQALEDRGILGELVLSEYGNMRNQFGVTDMNDPARTGLSLEQMRAGDKSDPIRHALANALVARLDKMDKDKNGIVSIEELQRWAGEMPYQKTDKGKFIPMFNPN